jgi:RNA polymerase sigma-70 factor (ECF subfamily)
MFRDMGDKTMTGLQQGSGSAALSVQPVLPWQTAGLARSDTHEAAAADAILPLFQAWCSTAAGHEADRAFAVFYEATVDRVYAVARRFTRDEHAAEEVAEEVYLQAWRDGKRYDPARGTVMAWLLIMARTRALDWYRRQQASPVEYRDEVEYETDAAAQDPLDMLATTDAHSVVHDALLQLKGSARQMVALAFMRGLTHSEIADITQQPLGTVKTVIRRAMKEMRNYMQQHAPQIAQQFLSAGVIAQMNGEDADETL